MFTSARRDRPAAAGKGVKMSTISPFTAQAIDREFRSAIAHGATTADEVRLARALFDVHAVEVTSTYHRDITAAVTVALGAAARLTLQPSQVRRLYGNGQLTYDLVNEAVAAAA
ncbi:hypothetical protein ADAWI_17 [Mycobacterium phage Adawi]|uniref:Uncharacterized protein n=1 Tax=Mycobacterium phage Adawi TaxID=1354507 RepID=T2A947_9CAUD|nr:hypothetical protein ADAWI_17 [Mycobacterium phage Adawi]AGU91939.1 hypothetical protein ADAWI_17 [Mycobacterium phage Adawi]